MRTLTRDEARRRAALLQVSSYDVTLELTDGPAFTSTTEVRFTCREPGASTFLELDAELLVLQRDGRQVEATVEGSRIVLVDLAGEEVVRVTARGATTRTGQGLHRVVDPADGQVYLYSQAFLDDAQRIFACFDQPDLKAPVRLTVTAPDGWTVLANSRGRLVDGRHVFDPTPPLSTYLFAVAAGPWHGEQRDHDGVRLGVWCRRSLAPHLEAAELLDLTAVCLDFQQEVFGRPYPFGPTYDQLFVPEFNAGAMENPGLITFSDELFVFRSRATQGQRRLRAQVVAHEMAHMWFGDLVTMRWWDDLWLNESFAELLGLLTVERATGYDGALPDFCLGRKAWGYRADQLPTTHPISGDVPDSRTALLNFDGISYAKGAALLRQLSVWLGEQVFFAGVRRYLDRHAWGNTALADLLDALQEASGRDLRAWSRAWLQTTGAPLLRVEGGRLVQQPARPHRVGVGAYDDEDGVLRLRERVEPELVGTSAALELAPAALVLPNDGDLAYAKVRLPATSLEVALRRTGDVADPLARAVLWGALWDTARDGELPAADLVGAVLAGVAAEPDPDLVETLLSQARHAATRWTPDGQALLAALAEHSVAAADAHPPGSDLQLVHVRAAASATSDAELLRGWRDGGAPAGLVVDAELRWHLVGRLAALGGASADDVAAELDRDRTTSGEQHAAYALAARPDAAGKAAVWAELLGTRELSNGRARSLGAGFGQDGQEGLLRPYASRWAAEVPGLFERRSPQLATTIARLLFPATVVEAAVLAVTELGGGLPAGLRRVVLEERDELARALRNRQG